MSSACWHATRLRIDRAQGGRTVALYYIVHSYFAPEGARKRPKAKAPAETRRSRLAAACLVPVVARACYKRSNCRSPLISRIVKYMISRRPVKVPRPTRVKPALVGVIASFPELHAAVQTKQPPDLFELRLDCLL